MDEPTSSSHQAPPPGYLFTELTSLDELSFPATSSKRIKFTCVAASPHHLALGTSSGTVYVFSRFRPKSPRNGGGRSSLPPVEVFTTKDGQVSRIRISPDEQQVAVGGESGRVTVAGLAANGLATAVVYTSPGDARRTDRVTDLCWSHDSKYVFASHGSGALVEHKLTQSVFRTSCRLLATMDSEVVQLEMSETGRQLLVSTLTASFVHDIESRTTSQVGKKTRNARMGACFVQTETCEFIVASRPNGRLWEANSIGVVYRTHQFRQSARVPRLAVASYRSSFKGSQKLDEEELKTAANEDVQLLLLNCLKHSSGTFLVSASGSKLLVVDTETSLVVLVTDLGKEILQYAVCGADVFVILNTSSSTTAAVKLTFLTTEKAVEKLHLRGCYQQAAAIVTKTTGSNWESSVLKGLLDGLDTKKKEKNTEMLKSALKRILERMEINESTYDNDSKTEEVSKKLPSGVHRVVCQPTVSGFEDDFSLRFTSPLRERSRSSPTVDLRQSLPPSAVLAKQNSMPLTAEEVEVCSRHGTPDVTEQDILERARTILESDGRVVEADSLRTLLQFDLPSPDLRFKPQITVTNAAKALAELAMVTPLDVSSILTVDRRVNASGTKRTGPTIIKPVRRQVSRPTPVVPKASLTIKSPVIERNSNIIDTSPNKAEKTLLSDDQNNMDLEAEWLDQRISEIKKKAENGEGRPTSAPSTSSDSESMATTESGRGDVLKLDSQGTEADTDHCCRHCGIHRSWLGLSLLASVCKRVTVERAAEKASAVPSSPDNWARLLLHRLRRAAADAKICPRCEAAFASSGRVLSQLPRSCGLTPAEHKIDATAVKERVKENGRARLETICSSSSGSCCASPSKAVPQDSSSQTDSSPFVSPLAASPTSPPASLPPLESVPEAETELLWLSRVEVPTLLLLCSLVLGYRGLLSLLKEHMEVADLMEGGHWATLVQLAIREQQMKRDAIGAQVVKEVLDSLRLSQFLSVHPSQDKSPSPRASISRRAAPPPIYSWVIDSTGSCLICTLPLQTQVKGEELMVRSFQCGHTYHSKCLSGKSYCVACRVRARKMSSNLASPQKSPAARLPVKK